MAIKESKLETNFGKTVDICTYTFGYLVGGSNTYYGMAEGSTNIPSMFSLYKQAQTVMRLGMLDDEFMDYLSAWHTQAELESVLFSEAKTMFNNYVVWLWGSFEEGGVYMRRLGLYLDRVIVGSISGFAQSTNDNTKFKYLFNENAINCELLQTCCLMYDEYYLNENGEYSLHLFHTGGLIGDRSPWYQNLIPSSVEELYEPKLYTNSLVILFGEKEWYPILGTYFPARVWNCDTAVSLHSSIADYRLSDEGADGWTLLSGNPFGNALLDDYDDLDDGYDESGYSGEGGGDGSYPSGSGNEDFEDVGGISTDAVTAGFVGLYNPTAQQVKDLNDWLFTDITDALSSQLKRLIADPIDYILFIAMVHFTPSSAISEVIKYAGISTGITAPKIKQFHTLDFGTIKGINKYEDLHGDTETFLDYSPNTKVKCHLPYIGIVDLNPDTIIGADLHLKYQIDMLSGVCVAQLKSTRWKRVSEGDADLNDVLYEFQGNIFDQIPVTGTDWKGLFSSMLSLAGGIGSAVTGNVAGVGQIANAIMTEKVSAEHSGSNQGSHGFIGKQHAYLILERPVLNKPYNYQKYVGFSSNITMRLSNTHGYTEVMGESLKLSGLPCTDDELEEIKQMLTDGVILP